MIGSVFLVCFTSPIVRYPNKICGDTKYRAWKERIIMKKIGILTFHRSYNYGAFMQCYTLTNKIQSDFPDAIVEVIDYITCPALTGYEKEKSAYPSRFTKMLDARNKAIADAQDRYLSLSEYKLISDDYEELFKKIKDRYDVVIVGSDAVWNWNGKGFPNAYFLGGDLGAVKMSYAASAHLLDYKKMTSDQNIKLKEILADFSYIGVREDSAKDMIKCADSSLTVYRNCDPTVLLDIATVPVDMVQLKEKLQSKGVDFSKPIIGLMAGVPYGKMIKKYYKDKVQIVALYTPNKYADVYLYDLDPLEWSRVFSLFNVTVTHFFHGTMLSLRNLTPVIPIENTSEYNTAYITKIKYAMYNMGLDEFHVTWKSKKSILHRGLRKYGVIKDKKFWYAVCKKIDGIIENPPTEKIRLALEKEAETYNSFHKSLEKILMENVNND